LFGETSPCNSGKALATRKLCQANSSLSQFQKGEKMMAMHEILLVDAKTSISWAFGFILQSNGYLITLAPDVDSAWEEIDTYHFDLILVYLAGYEPEKIHFLQRLQRKVPQPKVMAIGDPRNKMLPFEVFQIELEDYLFLPFDSGEFCRRVACCLEKNKMVPEAGFLPRKTRRERRSFETLDLMPL
jgi:DNA-binding response OmpR family regulator